MHGCRINIALKENLKYLVSGHRNSAQTVGAHVVSVMLPRAYSRRKTLMNMRK
jgi:hypothetical protein